MNKVADYSDDDGDKYQSSGEDWTPDSIEKKRGTRRASQRLRKKVRVDTNIDSSASEDEQFMARKQKKEPARKARISKRTPPVGMQIINEDFVTGGFLVLKKDLQTGDSSKQPCLWRIDGKALLQKYESFIKDEKILHRSTSIYTGWSPLDKDLYAPVNVKVQLHAAQQLVVELDWQSLKDATYDSD